MIGTGAAVMTGIAAPEPRLPPLGQVEKISEAMFAAALAYEVEQHCDKIGRNEWRVFTEGMSLIYVAKRMGYTRAEIEAFIDDKSELARFRAGAKARLEAAGVSLEEQDSICSFGIGLIEEKSYEGSLLKKN